MKGRLAKVCVGLLLFAALAAASFAFPAYHEICERRAGAAYEDCTAYQAVPFALIKIRNFLQDYNGAITAAATFAIMCFTVVLAIVGGHQVRDARIIQRAYVGLSHKTPEVDPSHLKGISDVRHFMLTEGAALNESNQKIQIAITNSGQTPAVVKGVLLGTMITEPDAPLPDKPAYGDTKDHPSTQAFLNANSAHYIRRGLDIPADEWWKITNKKRTLYVIGLVEYVDMFGQWHCAGYARRFAPGRGGNNLDFVAVEFAGDAYNYDIEITESERLTGKQDQATKESKTGLS